MSKIQSLKNSAAALALTGMVLALSSTAHAANPPAKLAPAPHADPQVKQLAADAAKSLREGNIPLATIQLKNALRLDPDNGTLRGQLGIVLLASGDANSAERELRQARLNGAKDEDTVPALVQAMLNRQEFADILAQFPDPAANDKSKLAVAVLRGRGVSFQATGNPTASIAAMDRSLAIQRDFPGLLERGRIAVMQNRPDEGVRFVDQALALSPNNPAALMTKAAIVRIKDKAAGLAMIDTVLKAHPDAVNAIIARIELLLEMKRTDDASKTVDTLLARAPTLPIAQFYKGVMLGLNKKPLDGWRIVQSLPAEFIQSNERIAVGAAQLAYDAGNRESANSILTTYIGQHQNAIDARMRLVAVRLAMNNAPYALEVLQPLMASSDPVVLQLISATYARLNQPTKSVEFLRRAQAAGSKDPDLAGRIAMIDISQANTAQGVQEILDLLKRRPNALDPVVGAVGLLVRQGKFAEAYSIADQADKLNPKSAVPPFLKGQITFGQKKPDESLNYINLSLQRDPHYLPALFARAQGMMNRRKFADAVKDLKTAQAVAPGDQSSYVRLAEIAAMQKQLPQSVALLKQGIAVAPKVLDARIVLARLQISQKQFPDALATLKAALQVAPNNPAALALQGQVQQAMGQKVEAINTNKMLTQKYQRSSVAEALLASSLLASNDKKGAVAAMQRAVKLSPDVEQYRRVLINLQMNIGDKDGAAATARDWANSHHGPDGTMLLAATLISLNRLPDAATVIAKAQAVRPDWQLTVMESHIATLRGDGSHGLFVLKNWLADHSTDLAVREAYGDALLAAKSDNEALAQYEIILKARGDNAAVLNNAAWLLREKDLPRALTLATKAQQLQPGSPDISDTLGWLLLKKNDAKNALPVLERAHTLGPQNSQITYHLAMALNALGRKAEAKQMLKETLAKNDKFQGADDAKKLLQQL